ncbi:ABC transporter permease [Nesterenkonia sp. MY13]|uniref:ABC transporter permease n=1 Tax=Nesterenkonia sedimenti TaxID=1463632 RepID=A0A7X8TLH8_9MICC|nr:ABC transporter permease [Nesterenkonia sedimenti]NLS10739.1 ABC transporter permease [Nesterenkonia sedimenti]
MIKRLLGSRELLLAAVILVLAIVFGMLAPQFFSFAHMFGIGRSAVVLGLLSLGLLLVMITGGIDVSVSATAVASMYITSVALLELNYHGPFLLAAVLAVVIGAVFGLVNATLVTILKLPSLIVTLGTLTLFRGGLLAFVGSDRLRELPAKMSEFSTAQLFTLETGGRPAPFHVSVAVLIVIAVLLAWALRSTTWGKSMYAVGDDEVAARRLGVAVTPVKISAFVLAGALAGLAGIMSGALNRAADPFTIVGVEMDALAAVVLGGAAVTGGRGSVLGTMLGVILITMVAASLVLVGIPSAWRHAFVGIFLLLGLGIPALRQRRIEKARGMVVSN